MYREDRAGLRVWHVFFWNDWGDIYFAEFVAKREGQLVPSLPLCSSRFSPPCQTSKSLLLYRLILDLVSTFRLWQSWSHKMVHSGLGLSVRSDTVYMTTNPHYVQQISWQKKEVSRATLFFIVVCSTILPHVIHVNEHYQFKFVILCIVYI